MSKLHGELAAEPEVEIEGSRASSYCSKVHEQVTVTIEHNPRDNAQRGQTINQLLERVLPY